jgi:hypothetical protein
MIIRTMLKSASESSGTEWSIGSRSMSHGPSAPWAMHPAHFRQPGARLGRRASAVLATQEGNPTLHVIISCLPMQKQFGCIKKNTRSGVNSHHRYNSWMNNASIWNIQIWASAMLWNNKQSASVMQAAFSNNEFPFWPWSGSSAHNYRTYWMQGVQKGKIGITLVSHWFTPLSRSKSDVAAARRQVDFMLGWYILCDHCSILSGGRKAKKKTEQDRCISYWE